MGDELRLHGPAVRVGDDRAHGLPELPHGLDHPFRSFKDLRLNARTFALVAFAVGLERDREPADASPAFVLVWLLSCYVVIGLVETRAQPDAQSRPTRRGRAAELPPAH